MQTINQRGKYYSAKLIAKLGMLTALAVVLTWLIHFPIIPGYAFLEYDPADIPILIGTLTFGPFVGLMLTIATSAVQAFTVSAASGMMGFLMHTIATGTMAIVCGLIYNRGKTWKSAALGLGFGALAMTIVMIPLNLLLTPLFIGAPVTTEYIVKAAIPFNLFKSVLNGVVTFILYQKLGKILKSF